MNWTGRNACRSRALLLVYPPPASQMAMTALQSYNGSHVAIIGEWDGDTGTFEFAQALWRGWVLDNVVALPNWTDTAHDLTVWRRRDSRDVRVRAIDEALWPACSSSGACQASERIAALSPIKLITNNAMQTLCCPSEQFSASTACTNETACPRWPALGMQKHWHLQSCVAAAAVVVRCRAACRHALTVLLVPSAGVTLAQAERERGTGLRCCQYARDIVVSDETAWAAFQQEAYAQLALRFVYFSRKLVLTSELDFRHMFRQPD